MSEGSARADLAYAKQYGSILQSGDASALLSMTHDKRTGIMKSLANLSKFTGNYGRWKQIKEAYALKWSDADSDGGIRLFMELACGDNQYSDMLAWIKRAINALPSKYAQVLVYDVLTGLRASESCYSIQLINDKAPDYVNPEQGVIEHFRFPDRFIRRTKRAYASIFNDELLNVAGKADTEGYNAIFMALKRREIGVNIGYCRKLFATFMRNKGVQAETVDLYQGRISRKIFVRHYYRPDAKQERAKIRRLLPRLLNEIN